MRHIFKLLAASVAAATICSCSSLTGYPTDAEASYAKAIEIAKKSVDTDKFKVYSLSFMEGETLSDNLFLISVKLVNKDNQAFSQSYYMTGLDPTALSDELACLHDLAHGERQQGESADHEDDRRGSGAQDGHAADADAERIYQGYDDHAGADGQR